MSLYILPLTFYLPLPKPCRQHPSLLSPTTSVIHVTLHSPPHLLPPSSEALSTTSLPAFSHYQCNTSHVTLHSPPHLLPPSSEALSTTTLPAFSHYQCNHPMSLYKIFQSCSSSFYLPLPKPCLSLLRFSTCTVLSARLLYMYFLSRPPYALSLHAT